MLVLNRRPGESIVIEHEILLTVVSLTDRKVWLRVEGPGIDPPVRVCATVVSRDQARLEIAGPTSVAFDGDGVKVEVGGDDHPSIARQAVLSLNRSVGESAAVGRGLVVGIGSVARGNPCITLDGPEIGSGLRVTPVRMTGSYVRVGVEAPERRVYRKELWDDLVAANQAAAGEGDDLTPLLAADPDGAAPQEALPLA